MVHLHNGIPHSSKKEGTHTFFDSIDDILLRAISPSEKDKYHVISHVQSNEQNKLTNKMETEV